MTDSSDRPAPILRGAFPNARAGAAPTDDLLLRIDFAPTPRRASMTTGRMSTVEGAGAIEPMTAPPDALNSGLDLRWLEPCDT